MNEKLLKLSKALSIIFNIGKVLSLISIPFIVLVMIFTPVITNNIKIDNETISVFDYKINYNIEGTTKLSITADGKEESFEIDSKKLTSNIIKAINEVTPKKLNTVIELNLLIGIATSIITFIVLNILSKIFKNISNKEVFTSTNTSLIKEIPKYLVMLLLLPILNVFVTASLFAGANSNVSVNINSFLLITIFVVIALGYVFEYGETLETK